MCGIVGAVAERNVTAILIEGLKRLEYRGYDSAGVAVFTNAGKLERMRRPGKVSELDQALAGEPLVVLVNGTLIAHGEVVVVNEKFGIRLTDVISPSERIKKLR